MVYQNRAVNIKSRLFLIYLFPISAEVIFQLTAIYGVNFKPKTFTDITMPAKQSYGPNIGKSTRIKSSLYFRFILGNTPPVPVYTGFFQNFIEPISTITVSDIRGSA